MAVTPPDPDGWLSISAYARHWGLSRTSVYRLIVTGYLTTVRVDTGGVRPLVRVWSGPPQARPTKEDGDV